MGEITRETFDKLENTDDRLAVLYDMLNDIDKRTAKLEEKLFVNKMLMMGAGVVGGAIVMISKLVFA